MANDIDIKVGLSTLKLKAQLAELKSIFKNFQNDYTGKQILDTQKKIKEAQGGITAAINKTNFTDINKELKSLSNVSPKLINGQKLFKNAIAKTNHEFDKMKKGLKASKPEFQSWAMSIMFAGMALQRMSISLITWGTKAYDEVSHSVIGTITETDRLNGAMLYLGYTIGEALSPIVALITPIVMWIANLANEWKKTTAFVIIFGLVVGTIALLFGALTLAINGVGNMLLVVFGIDGAKYLKDHGGLVGILKDKYKDLQTEIAATETYLSGLGVAGMVSLLGIILAIGVTLGYIFALKDAMGGWGELGKSVIRELLRAFAMLGDFLWNGIITVLQTIIALTARALDFLGISTPQWMTDFVKMQSKGSLLESVVGLEKDSWLTPSKGYGKDWSLIPKYNKVEDLIPKYAAEAASVTGNTTTTEANKTNNSVININSINFQNVKDVNAAMAQLQALQTQLNGYS